MTIEGDDEEIVTGTESEGTEGSDAPERDDDSEVSAEHVDAEADDGESEQVDEKAGDKPSRGENRFQRLANERAAEKARADRAEAELIEARRQSYARQTEQTEAQQREMLALMTPEERAEFRIKQMESRYERDRNQDRITTASLMDKTAFDAKATVNPVYARYKDEVESRFQDQLRQGRPVEREILLKVLLGEKALSGASNSKPRKAAEKRVEGQRVASGSGKGDSPSNRGKAGETAESRLKGQYI